MKKIFILTLIVSLIFGCTSIAYADAFDNATRFLEDTRGFLVSTSTVFALIGVACGAIMKKLSMGNDQKIQMGNKLMIGSISAWVVVNALPLILTTVQQYMS